EFRPVLAQALDKNPAQRFRSISEMARQVAATASGLAETPRPTPPPLPAAPPGREPIPSVLLVPTSRRERSIGLCGMLLGAVATSALLAAGWALLFGRGEWSPLLSTFYVTLAASWAVLIPSKLWPAEPGEDSWSRRLLLMSLGF